MSESNERNFTEAEIKEIKRILRRLYTAWLASLDAIDHWKTNEKMFKDETHVPFECMLMVLRNKCDGISDELSILEGLLDLPGSLYELSADDDESWIPTLEQHWENRDRRRQAVA